MADKLKEIVTKLSSERNSSKIQRDRLQDELKVGDVYERNACLIMKIPKENGVMKDIELNFLPLNRLVNTWIFT